MVRLGVLVWAHHILTVETDLASQAKSLQFYQELKSQMISTQGVQTNDLPNLPKYKMRIFFFYSLKNGEFPENHAHN